jgi:anti-sigma factor RsiW
MSTTNTITDEELVAYSDGALETARVNEIDAVLEQDECLTARLSALDFDKGAVFASFKAMAGAAPLELLRSQVHALTAKPRDSSIAGFRRLKVAAALFVAICVGWGAARLDGQDSTKDWRVAVADYQRLYATSTLSQISSDLVLQQTEVATVADTLGLPIKLDQLQLADMSFKRAQLLQFNGQLLAQFAYLGADGVPLSFCATRNSKPDNPIRVRKLRGLSAALWDKNGYSFILIGAGSTEAVRQAAVALSAAI